MSLLVGDVFRRAAAGVPNRPAASLDGLQLTFAELDAHANRVGRALATAGVGPGDRVAWRGQTSLDAVALFVAVARLGAVFVPVNPRLSDAEAASVLERARPRLVLDMEVPADDSESPLPDADLDERDPHVIFFTSGSTGEPKGAVLSHRANVLRTMPGNIASPPGTTVCMFPQFHMAAWTIGLGTWQAGNEVAFVSRPEPGELLGATAERRARRIYLIPAVWSRLLAADLGRYDLSCLREADTGTSATPPELLAAIREALPHTVTRVMYGSTEAGPATMLGWEDLTRKPGSVGLPSPGVEIRVSAEGEVCVRSEFLMTEYFEDPAATAAALAGGWYHSGDAGVVDDEGYLSITGRLRDVIRTGGETVAPLEVEGVLAEHPAVAEVAVVGMPDAAWGEVVCAAVVCRSGQRLELEELRRHCEGRLASFKHPRRLAIVDALPRTLATGQVQRSLLVERLAAGAT